tara:strand:- start:270 stop:749 length:480 start_codon:yes stop_codon:yes gene_type:complete
MKLKVLRFSSQKDSTSGLLFEENKLGLQFLCYTLEDEHRDDKVRGETRIPEGTYKIKLRNEGGFNEKYKKRYSEIHKGMLHVTGVPNFEWILIHCGNTDEHTAGCLLVGDSQENNVLVKNGFIGKSSNAYKRIYPDIAEAIENGEEVLIQYIDYDANNI